MSELIHYGIQGQKWGTRRWQYADGRFNEEGKIRYGKIHLKKDKGTIFDLYKKPNLLDKYIYDDVQNIYKIQNEKNETIGVISYDISGLINKSAYINLWEIKDKNERHKGYGSEALKLFEEEMKKRKVKKIRLGSAETMKKNVWEEDRSELENFYEKRGYKKEKNNFSNAIDRFMDETPRVKYLVY